MKPPQAGQLRWSQLRAYHRLAILMLLATVWAVITLSGMHAFLHSSSDPTRGDWQPVSAAGLVPRSLGPGDSADRGDDNAVLEHLGSLLETVQTSRLSDAQRVQLEDRLQRALLKLEHAVVAMDGMGGPDFSTAGRVSGNRVQGERPDAAGEGAGLTEASAEGAASEAGGADGDAQALHSDRDSTGLPSVVDADSPLGFLAENSEAIADQPAGGQLGLERSGAPAEGSEGEGWEILEREAAVLEEE
jgi:hypothetical protein